MFFTKMTQKESIVVFCDCVYVSSTPAV